MVLFLKAITLFGGMCGKGRDAAQLLLTPTLKLHVDAHKQFSTPTFPVHQRANFLCWLDNCEVFETSKAVIL